MPWPAANLTGPKMVNRPKDLIEPLARPNRQEITDIVGVVGPLGAWAAESPVARKT
jgi:hypothetical protein